MSEEEDEGSFRLFLVMMLVLVLSLAAYYIWEAI